MKYIKRQVDKILIRLKVKQTQFGESVTFTMRTFRFMTDESAVEQQQTISCSLHLEPSESISQDQAPDCTCYTQEGCQSEYMHKIIEFEACLIVSPNVY